MNEFLPIKWIETVDRLALGLETIDAGRGTRVAHRIQVLFNDEARGLPRPKVERHASCLHVLRYAPGVKDRIQLRFVERPESELWPEPPRRFVPRLISFPVLTFKDAESKNYRNRVRRPRLFPGAAYEVASGMTGLRGRVELRGNKPVPVRWARIVAKLPG